MDTNKRVTLFPERSLSKTEEDILAEIYKNPTVVKHLQIMAQNTMAELVALGALEKDATYLAKAHATVQGTLAVLQTLLEIANIPVAQTQEE